MRNDPLLSDRVTNTAIPALTVGISRHGTRTVASGGRTPTTESSPYRIASLTKPLTAAAAVLALAGRGIPLWAPAIDLIPSLKPDWKADSAITVENLLGQVSGLRPSVDSTVMAALGDRRDALQEGARLVVQAGSERAPGERWSYYNGNYFLLGAILSAISGTSFESVLTRMLLRPWGLAGTGFGAPAAPVTGWDRQSRLPADAYPRARRPSGGLWSCVADLLTFSERLLGSASLLEETRRPRTRPEDPMTYGLGWAIGGSGQMYLNGRLPGYRTAILLVPRSGYASVALASETNALPEIARILSDLQRDLTGEDLSGEINGFAA